MSAGSADPHAHEIIIVKHGHGDHEDAHHGGVWKIAFADFMTALMCFFLVMWLINAANEETKVSVASYFNPIKLVDRNASKRGLDEVGAGPQSAEGADTAEDQENAAAKMQGPANAGVGEDKNSEDVERQDVASDEHLFTDPYAVLAEIAAESGEQQNLSAKGDGGAASSGAATGASGGESFRDPFAPDFWSKQVEQDRPGEPDLFERPQVETADQGADPRSGLNPGIAAAADPDANDAFSKQATAAPAAEPTQPPPAEAAVTPTPSSGAAARSEQAAKEIREAIEKAFGKSDKMLEGITVTPTDRGILVSMTDQLDYGMFEVGSAMPRRDLVLAMEKVAAILNARQGAITISGHTDARPFRSKSYDNWRLSSARAQAAYYMLVRGGLDEKRIMEVSGFADRRLKVAEDPYSDRNRRIEILLETAGG